jgi:hypothetical protein
MKAVLEFNYPEDEDKLRYALHGDKAVFALIDIQQVIRAWQKHDGSEPEKLVEKIQGIAGDALTMLGE